MAVKICDDLMTPEVDGTIIAKAERRPDGWWQVTSWLRFFDRNQAITALAITSCCMLRVASLLTDSEALISIRLVRSRMRGS